MRGGKREGAGRKPAEIDLSEVEKLSVLHVTDEEMSGFFRRVDSNNPGAAQNAGIRGSDCSRSGTRENLAATLPTQGRRGG